MSRRTWRGLVGFGVFAIGLQTAPAQAAAEIVIRNEGAKPVYVAIAYSWHRGIDWNETGGSVVDGFWRLGAGEEFRPFSSIDPELVIEALWVNIRPAGGQQVYVGDPDAFALKKGHMKTSSSNPSYIYVDTYAIQDKSPGVMKFRQVLGSQTVVIKSGAIVDELNSGKPIYFYDTHRKGSGKVRLPVKVL